MLRVFVTGYRLSVQLFGPVFNSQACLILEDGTASLSRKSVTIYQRKTGNIPEKRRPNITEIDKDIIIGLGGLSKLGCNENCRVYL
jgi:hypothetical protein